jgi:RNA polymerase sigma-70 factor (ECF subfamily)
MSPPRKQPDPDQGAPEGCASRPPAHPAAVARLPLLATDAEILAALADERPAGGAALYDRYRPLVRRILIRLLGGHQEINDLVQETFIAVIRTSGRVKGSDSLRGWITNVAVFTARQELRRRRRKRFLLFFAGDAPEMEAPAPTSPPEAKEALRATYRILSTLPADQQVAFALRFIEGMELTEVASACRVSLATIKRRLAGAKSAFEARARQEASLAPWIQGW